MDNEEGERFAERRRRTHKARMRLLPYVVQHEYDRGTFYNTNQIKMSTRCIVRISTVGYATLNSGYEYDHMKPYSLAEATFYELKQENLMALLERDGEWNISAQWRADCTPLHRTHYHHDIHCGEHVDQLKGIVDNAGFVEMLKEVKSAWSHFLRDANAGWNFNGLCFDPFGQCRSVAFARIVCFCLGKCGVQVMALNHLSLKKWQWQCCRGECTHCTNDPMSEEKEAVLSQAYRMWLEI